MPDAFTQLLNSDWPTLAAKHLENQLRLQGAGMAALRGRMPVRTGRLKRSLRLERRGAAVVVYAGVDYAIFVRGARAGFYHWRASGGVRRIEFEAARLALNEIVARVQKLSGTPIGAAVGGSGGFLGLPGLGGGVGIGQTPLPASPIF